MKRGSRGRQQSLLRVLQLLQRVQGCRYAPSLHLLANEFSVCERTIRRDMELLERVGIAVPKFQDEHNVTAQHVTSLTRSRLQGMTMQAARQRG